MAVHELLAKVLVLLDDGCERLLQHLDLLHLLGELLLHGAALRAIHHLLLLLLIRFTHLRRSSVGPVLAVVHLLGLVLEHLLLGAGVLLCGLQLLHFGTQLGDQHDQLHIVLHDVPVLLLMHLLLLVQALLKTGLRVLKVSSLVLELFLDIGIDLNVLGGLVLHVRIEVLVDDLLQLIEVVDVLDDPVNCIFELADLDVVLADLRSVLSDHIDHVFLSGFEVIDDVTKIGVDLVEMLQVLIHIVGLSLQSEDLLVSGSNVSLEFLDFVVKYKFEFLQFLRLLLKLVDVLLPITDGDITLVDFSLLPLDLLLEVLLVLLSESELNVFVLDLTVQLISILSQFLKLVLSELEFSLGS